jgi:elongation factor P--(R)-beta-lysine ligase
MNSSFTREIAHCRADVYRSIRDFFAAKSVLEVETPILSKGISTDPNIDVFSTRFERFANDPADETFFLQTSPELHMKRLLTQGFPSIFQITKVFRNSEQGNRHNPEFSMLEWYRIGFSMERLIDEALELCMKLIKEYPVISKSYQQVFAESIGIDPLKSSLKELTSFAQARSPAPPAFASYTDGLQFIMAAHVEPTFPMDTFIAIHHYPAAQAVLSMIDQNDSRTAKRFEIYLNGHELGNGYEELLSWEENEKRMQEDNQRRKALGKPELPVDKNFIDAMRKGMPACSGIAIGLDRIIMLKIGATSIKDVLAFPWEIA